ncbi:hypothetical protein IAR55_005208 [Kwoniella newhampshirensis]|uniref:INO80 complex subunit B-like conserved region domain-containing protein n=1 Tax=Kwoniella newhampshirensis TaxID=1651941 RepID=A0AAW0YVG7_9TREE
MAPKATPAIPSATRRAKRVIESASPSPSASPTPSPPPPTRTRGVKRPAPPPESESEEFEDEDVEGEDEDVEDAEGEDEEEEEEEELGAGEEEDGMESQEGNDVGPSRVSSMPPSEDVEMQDDSPSPSPSPSVVTTTTAPTSALKIKFKVNPAIAASNTAASVSASSSGGRPSRATAKKGAKKSKKIAEEALEDSDDELLLRDDDEAAEDDGMSSRRSVSPSKLTARQRAKGNKDLQETLLQLPNELTGKKQLVLTEAEKQERREETARRRKRQSEQKLQDEQDQTINRLLRAQTSKSRSKLDNPSPALDSGGPSSHPSPTRRVPATPGSMIRWVSTVSNDGDVVIRVAAPKEKDEWLGLDSGEKVEKEEEEDVVEMEKKPDMGICNVIGCGEKRKYRSVMQFEMGGCCLDHLKSVESGL